MRKATKNDRKQVTEIISETLQGNPGICWMLRKNGNLKKHIKNLADFTFFQSLAKEGIYISNNEKGVAICYKFNDKRSSLKAKLFRYRYAIKSLQLNLIKQILKLESYKIKQRPSDGEYLYFWFFCVLKDGGQAGFELKNAIYELSINQNIPVYAETSLLRTKIIYERFGFETYKTWENKNMGLKYWFIKLTPEEAKKHFVLSKPI